MLTVVIPTLLRCRKKIFAASLNEMIKSDSVSEIIIIDNTEDKIFNLDEFPKSSKIKLINDKENLYVNQAWNYGASIAENDKVLFINDDILCMDYIFDILDNELTDDVGVITCHIHQDRGRFFKNPEAYFKKMATYKGRKIKRDEIWKRGCLFGINKRNLIKIPDDLKIYYGDNLICMYVKKVKKLPIIELGPIFAVHWHGGSVSVEIEKSNKNSVIHEDSKIWRKNNDGKDLLRPYV